MSQKQSNPFAPVGQLIQDVSQNLQQQPAWIGATSTLKRWQRQASCALADAQRPKHKKAPSVVVLPRAHFAAIIPGDSIAETVVTTGFLNFLNLYNSALIVRLVLTWFPNPPAFIEQPLSTICDPYLNLFRGLLPPLGGTLDFSPVLAFVVLNLFTNTAAALPAELGPDGKTLKRSNDKPGFQQWLQPSKYQQIWANRMQAQQASKQGPAAPPA